MNTAVAPKTGPGKPEAGQTAQGKTAAPDSVAGRLRRIDERLTKEPQNVGLLTQRADLLLDLGRHGEAHKAVKEALKRAGASPTPLLLGIAARVALLQGRYDEAISIARKGLNRAPAWPEFHAVLGGALRAKGDLKNALVSLERAVNLNPLRRSYRVAVGQTLEQMGDLDRAERVYRHALYCDPQFGDAALNLANVLHARNALDEAESFYGVAMRLLGKRAAIYGNLGALERKRRRYDAAHRSYRRSLVLSPNDGGTLYNLGNLLRAENRLEEACRIYRRSLVDRPEVADAHWNLSLALLAMGDLDEGFREYEWRWKYKGFPSKRRNFKQPMWDGGPLDGRTLLIHTEQGVGDVLQFLRFLPAAIERKAPEGSKPGRVIFEVHDTLLTLMGDQPGVDQTVERLTSLPSFDVHIPMLSLPLVLGVKRMEDLPVEVPYLSIPEGPDFPLPEADPKLLKVGFVWGGNPLFPQDVDRSTRIDHYLPLFDMPGVQWFCLQKGDREPEISAAPETVVRLNDRIKDFRDTAIAMTKLDVVVSTCTSVVHLSGALGVPTIALLSETPDWRWLVGRSDSPWYPNTELIRQRSHGDWPGVFGDLRAALADRVADKARNKTGSVGG